MFINQCMVFLIQARTGPTYCINQTRHMIFILYFILSKDWCSADTFRIFMTNLRRIPLISSLLQRLKSQ